MRAILFTLTSVLSFALGQQNLYPNATYDDALAAISNETSLAALWTVLQEFIEIASQYSHYSNVTIIAPDNKAVLDFQTSRSIFANPTNRSTLQALFSYHILQGQFSDVERLTFGSTFLSPSSYTNVTGGQMVGVSKQSGNLTFLSGEGQQSVTVQNTLYYQGGMIHVVDRVLTVPMDVSATASSINLTATSGALNFTGLTTSLGPTWDATIFAPANSGFEAIASVAANMTVEDVQRLMKYHMLTGNVVYSNEFVNNQELKTTEGTTLTITTRGDGSIYVNNARIIQSDILLSNGVLHVIDEVLNPDNTATAPTSTTTGIVAFAGAQANGTLPFSSVPILGSQPTGPALNTTVPSPTSTPSDNSGGTSISTGAIAAVALGAAVGVAAVITGIILCLKSRGYRVKVSRKSLAISSPRIVRDEQYELPPGGGRTEKVELPACVPPAYVRPERPERPDQGMSDTSTEQSDTTQLLEKPPAPPEKDDFRRKKQSPATPSSAHDGIWELSADHDVRARIERLLNSRR